MLAQMRLTLQTARAIDNQKVLDAGRMPPEIDLKVADAYRFATSYGAEAIGLGSQIGSLEVGKQADIILIRQDGIHHAPRTADPIASIVLQTRPSDIDSVFVAGVARKRHGALVGVDLAAVQARAQASADHLAAAFETAMADTQNPSTRSVYASEVARATRPD